MEGFGKNARARRSSPCSNSCPLFPHTKVTALLLFLLALLRTHSQARGSRYSLARTALKVPCFDGRSPTSGENSASPVIKSGVSNFPLHANVPASRPTLPRRNSTGPENVTAFPSPRDHFAPEDVAAPQTFALGSSSSNVPLPSPCASKRTERCSSFANVISTFHLPMRFGDWASGKAENDAFIANTRINARVAFTFFSNPNLVSRQDTFLGLLAGAQCILA